MLRKILIVFFFVIKVFSFHKSRKLKICINNTEFMTESFVLGKDFGQCMLTLCAVTECPEQRSHAVSLEQGPQRLRTMQHWLPQRIPQIRHLLNFEWLPYPTLGPWKFRNQLLLQMFFMTSPFLSWVCNPQIKKLHLSSLIHLPRALRTGKLVNIAMSCYADLCLNSILGTEKDNFKVLQTLMTIIIQYIVATLKF